jgi:hypothetical protein
MAVWHDAALIYSKAVCQLSRNIGVLSEDNYDKLKQNAEHARQRSIEAQASLESHIKEHGCSLMIASVRNAALAQRSGR